MIEQLMFFHDFIILVIVGVIVLVGYFLFVASAGYFYSRGIYEGQRLEGLWTVLPGILLVFIVFPSLKVLYYIEEGDSADIAVRVVGHQWFWSYEYLRILLGEIESYINSRGKIRLVEADN
ncbi:hypothetical protein DRW41_22500 [Neobacillus piezotolerans]|uniref:cytochrome-c oxidase n=1 Tax=Neobacillus piezotolerans TaxID=2259171 RepID=A0A3D8GKJ0_9BACI|nr:hypothetical protein DRW41_22500 [Neobacillus piezotolerans]